MTSDFRGLPALLDMLGDLEIQRLLVEGGPFTINQFLNQNLVDEFILVKSNKTHISPVQAEFDLSKFTVTNTETWGNEEVTIYNR